MARFLIIDDDTTLRQLMALTLASAGHEVREAASGDEGVAQFAQQRPDVVITDLVMPRESIAVVIELSHRHPEVPFIVVSGTTDTPNHLEIARLLGARHRISKPFGLAEFLRLIEAVLTELNAPTQRAPMTPRPPEG